MSRRNRQPVQKELVDSAQGMRFLGADVCFLLGMIVIGLLAEKTTVFGALSGLGLFGLEVAAGLAAALWFYWRVWFAAGVGGIALVLLGASGANRRVATQNSTPNATQRTPQQRTRTHESQQTCPPKSS